MTTSSNKKDLPPNWIVKTSRQYPSLSYYANVKTGQSTWKHPSLLKESELKCLTKKKGKKKLHENNSEKVEVVETPIQDSGEMKQNSELCKKVKSPPFSRSQFFKSLTSNQESNDNTRDHRSPENKKDLNGYIEICRSLANIQESHDSTEDHKSKPIKFTIKKKNALLTSSGIDSSPKKPVAVHPSILLFQKISARDHHLKIKRKVHDDKEEKQITQIEVQRAKKTKSDKEDIFEVPLSATKSDTSVSKNEFVKSERLKSEDINKRISDSGRKVTRKNIRHKTHKGETSVISPEIELTCSIGEEEKTDVLSVKDKQNNKKKDKNKEDEMYKEFTKHRSNLWKKKYRCQGSKFKETSKSESYNDEEHSKTLSEEARPEQPKEEVPESKLSSGNSSEQLPNIDNAKVTEPVPESVPAEDIAVFPKATDMEIDEEELFTEIANFRGSASYSSLTVSDGLSTPTANYSSTSLYFVVDTNVLIRDIEFLQQLKSAVVDGRETVIVVPYVALKEMDGLKKSASIGRACQAAVRWCNQHFEARDPRVQGQTYSNYRTTLKENKEANADDLVRDCCLLLAREGLCVCLLSNDVNLRNKALMSELSAISAQDLKNKLKMLSSSHYLDPSTTPSQAVGKCEESQMNDFSLTERNVGLASACKQHPPYHQAALSTVNPREHKHMSGKEVSRSICSVVSEESVLLERITTSLHHTLSSILQNVMKEVYEDLWLTVLKHKPPWSLKEVFACWEKHWIAVMIDRFPSGMKELLAEINKLLTTSQDDVQKLLKRVMCLYSHFESTPYGKHILPIQDPSSDVIDMLEAPPAGLSCSTPPPTSTLTDQSSHLSGVINVEKMINEVGAHITHFVALVLTAFGIQHKLPTISACESLTPDNARTSGVNLHQVIMSLGTAIARCVNERTSSALQELGHLLINFWSEAKLPCPQLPFMECDLLQFVESPSSMSFLECVLRELESLLQQLTQVLANL